MSPGPIQPHEPQRSVVIYFTIDAETITSTCDGSDVDVVDPA